MLLFAWLRIYLRLSSDKAFDLRMNMLVCMSPPFLVIAGCQIFVLEAFYSAS